MTSKDSGNRQAGESEKAFEAFPLYLEMGSKRSLAKVGQKLGKNTTQIERWSVRWKWADRVKDYQKWLIDSVDQKAQEEAANRLPDIMGENELLARVSMLARADASLLFNEKGEIDVKDIKNRGLGYLLAGVQVSTTTYPNGAVTVRQTVKIEPRLKFLELMGRHLDLWDGEIKNPGELLRKLAEESRKALPAAGETRSALNMRNSEMLSFEESEEILSAFIKIPELLTIAELGDKYEQAIEES